MSECVVRMEMPESCDCCPCLDDYGDYPRCRISDEQRGYNFDVRNNRMPNCPILAVLPEKHGRLVDKDEMLKKIENYHRYMTVGRESDPRCIIEDAPTIVPADTAERSET